MTDTKIIDVDEAIAALEMAVAEQGGNYIYQKHFGGACVYAGVAPYPAIEGLCAACMIGLALHLYAHLTVEQLDELKGSVAQIAGFSYQSPPLVGLSDRLDADKWLATTLDDTYDSDLVSMGVHLTENAVRVLWAAQAVQDAGETWGMALQVARQVADGLKVA